jgi:Xaa-Pro aminopeptidase
MKSDIDAIMQSRNMEAIVVFGNVEHNPPMYYLTGGGHVNHAVLIKKRGGEAVLFHGDMERDEAAKSGLTCIPYSRYDQDELLERANQDHGLAGAMRMELMLRDAGVTSGRVGVYGTYDVGAVFGLLTVMQRLMPAIEFVGERREASIFMKAMETKDEDEVRRIRKIGGITTEVVGLVRDYLTSCEVR